MQLQHIDIYDYFKLTFRNYNVCNLTVSYSPEVTVPRYPLSPLLSRIPCYCGPQCAGRCSLVREEYYSQDEDGHHDPCQSDQGTGSLTGGTKLLLAGEENQGVFKGNERRKFKGSQGKIIN